MAREASVTQQQLSEVADALVAAGLKPTVRAIREKIGRGSMATLHKLLQLWETNSGYQHRQTNTEIDAEVVKAINSMISRQVHAAGKEAAERIADLHADVATIIFENDRQAKELEDTIAELDILRVQSSSQAGQIEELKSVLLREREISSQEAQLREAAQIELAKALLRIEAIPEMYAELKQARVDVRKFAEEAAELRGRLAELSPKAESV